jgi:hypothetical protein
MPDQSFQRHHAFRKRARGRSYEALKQSRRYPSTVGPAGDATLEPRLAGRSRVAEGRRHPGALADALKAPDSESAALIASSENVAAEYGRSS